MNRPDQHKPDESLARLLRLAGPRPAPSAQIRDEVYAGVHEHWREGRGRAQRRRRALYGAVAATVVGAIALVLATQRTGPVPVAANIGVVERAIGALNQGGTGVVRVLDQGMAVAEGATLRTAAHARAGLRLRNGASLRLAPDTELRVESAQRFTLAHGRVYLDTAEAPASVEFEIETAAGVVRDIGTRFEVASDDAQVQIRVRDGLVELQTAAGTLTARRGEALRAAAGAPVSRETFSPVDPYWAWTLELAPAFETDGARIVDLVDWVARETGREAHYADAQARNAAAITRISGTIAGRTPEQTLSTALAASRLQATLEPERVTISVAAR